MSDIGKEIVTQLITELLDEEKKSGMTLVGVYPGRYQPFGRHHYQAYEQLKKITGANTFIATSNKTDNTKSPFSFSEKQRIISKYGIPKNKIVRTKSPYSPEEILKKFDPKKTVLIMMYGAKDADRLKGGGKYYEPYKSNAKFKGYKDKGYYVIAKHESVKVGGKEISGTVVRNMLGSSRIGDDKKKKLFKAIFGWYDKSIFDLVVRRLKSISESHLKKNDLLTEGGAYGHMSHPFDDMNLTFGDFKNMITIALQGELDKEVSVTEKLDGQALSISWKNGKLVAARNKGQLKNQGANALSVSGVKSMFSGRGALTDAFVFAMKDLESAISSLSDKQRTKVFDEGKNFMATEIIFPKTQNVIPYDTSMLVFHGVMTYDDAGNPIGQNTEYARMLGGMIRQVNQNVQKTFTISSPSFITVPPHQDFGKKQASFTSKLNTLMKKYKLKDSDKFSVYHQMWWEEFVSKKAKSFKYSLTNDVLMGLVKRWAFNDKSMKKRDIMKSIDNEEFKSWIDSFDKEDHKDQVKTNMRPFEHLFLELGSEVLKNANGFLAANPKKSVQRIRKDLEKTLKSVRKSKDVSIMRKVKDELARIQAAGGFDALVPSEGLVFMYKNKIYKLTGSFAPINQLLGVLKYSR